MSLARGGLPFVVIPDSSSIYASLLRLMSGNLLTVKVFELNLHESSSF